MSRLWTKLATFAALGVLTLGPTVALAWNTAVTSTRTVRVLTEDTPCDNIDDYGADTFAGRFCIGVGVTGPRGSLPSGGAACCTNAGSNAFCTGAGTSLGGFAPCCTAAGTGTCTEALAGTCNADNLLPPDFDPAGPGCDAFADPLADFTDTTGAGAGTADFDATLTSTGVGTWTLTVPGPVYAGVIGQTVVESGAALIQNAQCTGAGAPHPCCSGIGTGACDVPPLVLAVDTVTGDVSAPTPSPAPSPPGAFQFSRANGLFPGIAITIVLEDNLSGVDAPFFGSSWLNTDPAGPGGGGPPFASQCLGAGVPNACCDGFLTDVAAPFCGVATLTGVPLGLSCSAALEGPGANFAVFGPGSPIAGGVPPLLAAVCDPPGLVVPGDASPLTNYIAEPGQSQVGLDTYITAFGISRVFAPLFGANATTPAFTTQDFKVVEVDTDGDGVTDDLDNCRDVVNADQADIGGVGSGSAPDGIGNACQCGDVNNDGRVTSADATVLARALLSPPTTCGATTGAGDCAGGFKCDANNSNTCSSADATIIARRLLTPPTATINPGCGPAAIVP